MTARISTMLVVTIALAVCLTTSGALTAGTVEDLGIVDFQYQELSSSSRMVISANLPFIYRILEPRKGLLVIETDRADTSKIASDYAIGSKAVKSVNFRTEIAAENRQVTLISIQYDPACDFTHDIKGRKLFLEFSLPGERLLTENGKKNGADKPVSGKTATAAETPKEVKSAVVTTPVANTSPAVAKPAVARDMQQKTYEFTNISVDKNGSVTKVTMDFSASIGKEQYKIIPVGKPARYVMDFYGARNRLAKKELEISSPHFTRIRTAQNAIDPEPVTRIVFDQTELVQPQVSLSGQRMILTFGTETAKPEAKKSEPAAKATTEKPTTAVKKSDTATVKPQPAQTKPMTASTTKPAAVTEKKETVKAAQQQATPEVKTLATAPDKKETAKPANTPAETKAVITQPAAKPAEKTQTPAQTVAAKPAEQKPIPLEVKTEKTEPKADAVQPVILSTPETKKTEPAPAVVQKPVEKPAMAKPAVKESVPPPVTVPQTTAKETAPPPVTQPKPAPPVAKKAEPVKPKADPFAEQFPDDLKPGTPQYEQKVNDSFAMPKEQDAPAPTQDLKLDAPIPQQRAPQLVAGDSAFFQTREISGETKRYQGKKVSLVFESIPLSSLILLLGQMTDKNFIVDPSVRNVDVSISLQDIPWDQALDVILDYHGLGKVEDDNLIRIATQDKLASEATERRSLAEQRALAVPLRQVTKPINYAKAADLAALLGRNLSGKGEVVVDARTNTLVISDIPTKVDEHLNLIEALDIPTKQVIVEARIVETTRDFINEFGLQYGFSASQSISTGTSSGWVFPSQSIESGGFAQPWVGRNPLAINLPSPSANTSLLGTFTNIAGSFSLDVLLTAAESEKKVRVLSRPRISAQNNSRAEIKSGVEVPYQVIQNNTVSIRFREATLRLEVTPHITSDSTVIMDVVVDKSSLGIQTQAGFTVQTRQATSTIRVKDGGVAVIGGVLEVSESLTQERVPLVSRIPLIGALFRNELSRTQNTELLIFIAPKIIG